MQNPDGYNADFEDTSDRRIEELLASGDERDQELGLALLDAMKREKFAGLLRIWSNENNWRLTAEDVAKIWVKTLTSIQKNVARGRFKKTGKLKGYIRTIANRRAIDFLRRRNMFELDVDVQEIKIFRYDKRHESPDPNLIKIFRTRYRSLTAKEKLVTTHDLRLYFAKNCEKRPSLEELTASVNKDGRHALELDEVESARNRGRQKLRGYDAGKGEPK